ncbi:MAG: hypothetical protein WBB43_18445 [Limnoraphis sp.]
MYNAMKKTILFTLVSLVGIAVETLFVEPTQAALLTYRFQATVTDFYFTERIKEYPTTDLAALNLINIGDIIKGEYRFDPNNFVTLPTGLQLDNSPGTGVTASVENYTFKTISGAAPVGYNIAFPGDGSDFLTVGIVEVNNLIKTDGI